VGAAAAVAASQRADIFCINDVQQCETTTQEFLVGWSGETTTQEFLVGWSNDSRVFGWVERPLVFTDCS
jgi:hypothetical protein